MIRVGTAVVLTPTETAPWLALSSNGGGRNDGARYDGVAALRDLGLPTVGHVTVDVASREERYPHDAELVAATLDKVRDVVGHVAFDALNYRCHVLPYERVPSFNGETWEEYDYGNEAGAPRGFKYQTWSSSVLYAKATPQHPGVTRYVAAHEVAHAIQARFLNDDYADDKRVDRAHWDEYVARRAFPQITGRFARWHELPGEVFADDVRVACGVEPGFWSHAPFAEPTPRWFLAFLTDVLDQRRHGFADEWAKLDAWEHVA